jgi:GntR family transcriptional regulator
MPLYQQIEQSIREMIHGSEFEPGDQIPPERELSATFNASRMTVRRAVEALIAQGLLERRSTSGTFVREANVIRLLSPRIVQSLSRQITGMGGEAGSRLLFFEHAPAPDKIRECLQLQKGSTIIFLSRLRSINGKPFCVERSYLPADMFPGLAPGDAAEPNSLYRVLKEKYEIQPDRSEDRLSISYATRDEAELLQIREGEAVLFFRSVVFDEKGIPFEFVKSINHAEGVVFESTIKELKKDN